MNPWSAGPLLCMRCVGNMPSAACAHRALKADTPLSTFAGARTHRHPPGSRERGRTVPASGMEKEKLSLRSSGVPPRVVSHQQWEPFESWPLGEAASQKKRRPGRSPPALMWAFPARLLPEQAADAKGLQKSAPFGLPEVGAPGDMAMLRVPGAGLEGRRWEAPGVRNSDPWSPARMVKTAWSTCRTG